VDSGATAHICKVHSTFTTFTAEWATVGGINENGPWLLVEGQGDVDLLVTMTGCEDRVIMLKNMWYCPNACNNLISESWMDLKGLEINKKNRWVKILKPNGEIIMEGNLHHWLYHMHCIVAPKSSPPAILTFTAKAMKRSNNLKLWHSCLGHLNYKYLHDLDKHKMVSGLDLCGDINNVPQCEGCALGKHPHAPFPSNNQIWAKYPIERLHGDLQGPFKSSRQGFMYVLAIVNDNSQKRWKLFIRTKSKAQKELQDLIEQLETLTG
jgi:GAG-pre-integrase domain